MMKYRQLVRSMGSMAFLLPLVGVVQAGPITGDTVTSDLTVEGDEVIINNGNLTEDLRIEFDDSTTNPTGRFLLSSAGEWVWGYGSTADEMMVLGDDHRLLLYDNDVMGSSGPSITLDPGDPNQSPVIPPSIKIGTEEVLTNSSAIADGFILNTDFSNLLDTNLAASLDSLSSNPTVGGNEILINSGADLDLEDGGIRGYSFFGIAFGNKRPPVTNSALVISHTGSTISDTSPYFYNRGFIILENPDLDQTLSIDPNQFATESQFHFQTEENFYFRTPDDSSSREAIARFSTDETMSGTNTSYMQIGNGTITQDEFVPTLLGNNESTGFLNGPSLMIRGTGKSTRDVATTNDTPVIEIRAEYHDGDPLNGPNFSAFQNRDIFSVANGSSLPALRIDADGYVGLGTKDPAAQLHVTDDAQVDGDITVDGNTILRGTVTLDQPQGDVSMGNYGP